MATSVVRRDEPAGGPRGQARLSPAQFQRISEMLHGITGINMRPGKEQLVQARLWKRVGDLGFGNFDGYLDFVEREASHKELSLMVDALATNETSFFREPYHFEYLHERLRNWFKTHHALNIWSAGCSSGEEPYTLALVVLREWPDAVARKIRILATDVSSKALAQARAGCYSESDLHGVPDATRRTFFTDHGESQADRYSVNAAPRELIHFARLNLMDPWPMRGHFDFIFCRNVMIYFDRDTQDRLVGRFAERLEADGHLMIGHSESLTGRALGLRYVEPAIYVKSEDPAARAER
jgi:chemotaxis protein methyltransferase CheR